MKKLHDRKGATKPFLKFDLKMKLTTLFLFASLFNMLANTGHSQVITLDVENTTVARVIDKIEITSDYTFVYNTKFVDLKRRVSIKVEQVAIETVLKKLFYNTKTAYEVQGTQIFLKEKTETEKTDRADALDNTPQDFEVKGVIQDSNGQPLPGANILEKGTTNGTQTDFDGNFSLTVTDQNALLIISYLGFLTQEVPVNGQTNLSAILQEDTAKLDEVVVVGYGTLSKANVTGSVSSIKSDSFKDIPVSSIEQGLASQLPGIEITQNSGQPGAANSISIRGTSTITAGSQPLVVLDGLPLSESTSLNSISPNDIASVEVLKDAASASIYGSRGANGVIIITTKKGQSGKSKFSFNSYIGFQSVANELDLLNARDHAIWDRDARNNYYMQFNNGTFSINDSNATRAANAAALGFNRRKAIIPSYVQPWLNGGDTSGLTDTDWQDELFRNAKIENYQISARGGNENISYFVSGGYLNQEGIVLGSNFERFSFRSNIEAKLSEKLKLGVNIAPTITQQNAIPTGFNTSPVNAIIMSLPYFPAYNPDGSPAISQQVTGATEGDQARTENPVAMALLNKDKRKGRQLLGGTFLELDIIEGLKAKTYFGIDLTNQRREVFNPSSVGTRNRPAPINATGSSSSTERLNWVIENTLTYSKTFNEKHNFDALLGYTFQEETYNFSEVTATDFPNDFVTTLNAGIVNGGTSLSSKSVLISYLARARYDYEGKYLLTATVRRDGSSRFGSNTRFGIFPSVSAGYRLSDEAFYPESAFVNDLKLRASWGLTGNNQIGDFGSQALLSASNAVLGGGIQSGLAISTSPNSNLSWEETSTYNFGIDLGVLNSKITASFDYYIATTNDLLLQVPVPAHTGFVKSLQNIGKVENKGIEFSLKANYNLGPVKATTSFNIASNKNKVLELGPGQEEIITGNAITRIGKELGVFYGYKTQGVFTSQDQINSVPSLPNAQVGEYIYIDVNGDGQISSADRTPLGSIFPDYTFGINSNFSYKGFDLGIVLQGVQGVLNKDLTTTVLLFNPEGWNNAIQEYFDNYYTPERGANAIYSRPNAVPSDNGFYRNTDVLHDDASFIRIRNITLGYTLPKSITETLKLDSLRLYLSSKNPFTFTNYRGYNPEQRTGNALDPTTGFDNYPVEKSFVFGLNVNF